MKVEVGLPRLEWPPYSPDFNPMENTRDQLKRAVYHRPVKPQTLQELLRLAISQERIRNLIHLMPRKLQAVIFSIINKIFFLTQIDLDHNHPEVL